MVIAEGSQAGTCIYYTFSQWEEKQDLWSAAGLGNCPGAWSPGISLLCCFRGDPVLFATELCVTVAKVPDLPVLVSSICNRKIIIAYFQYKTIGKITTEGLLPNNEKHCCRHTKQGAWTQCLRFCSKCRYHSENCQSLGGEGRRTGKW